MRRGKQAACQFQSLIWVACPTGTVCLLPAPAMVGFNPSYGLHALRATAKCPMVNPRTVSIPHMGCMPYGHYRNGMAAPWAGAFQSLIWVACPTGSADNPAAYTCTSFNPSYGLHALRAGSGGSCHRTCCVSIPHMGCMPYGPDTHPTRRGTYGFQSLIWVACPTGGELPLGRHAGPTVSIPHMGCMPYGHQNRRYRDEHAEFQSLIWVACPTGRVGAGPSGMPTLCFNPSYGLHALRAASLA